jgi:DNA-binding NtrC family response regulator
MLDITIGADDGIVLLRELKKMDSRLPIVMITGYRDADRVIESFRLGALDCLLKPFNFDYIKNNILNMITSRQK